MCCCTIERFCCMSLPTAGVFIGWVSTKISLVQSIIYIVILNNKNEIVKSVSHHFNKEHAILHTVISVLMSVYLAVSLLNLLASIMLIIGTKRNSHLMLVPWLVNNGIVLVFKTFFSFILLGVAVNKGGHIGFAIIFFIIFGIHCWAWSAIYSLFKNIRTNRGQLMAFANTNAYSSKLVLLNNSEIVPVKRY